MALGALCLAMVAPGRVCAKPGLCQRWRTQRKDGEEQGETSVTRDNEQPDFLEVDFVPESSPTKGAVTALGGSEGGASGDKGSDV